MDMKIANAALAYAKTAARPVEAGDDQSGGIGGSAGASFAKLVEGVVNDATKGTANSEAQAMKAVSGKADLTDIVAAVSNAEIALDTVTAIRDKVISAYQEVMRMPM